jgi:16S rRNA (cytosine967-C5)-methyltransferase
MAQVNICRTGEEEALGQLRAEGVSAERHPWLPGCLVLSGTGDVEELSAFRDGLFYMQDAAARLAVTAAGLEPGMSVLDACAAPGGKSFAAAMDMRDEGEILSCDIHPHKKGTIEAGAARLGLKSIRAAVMDAGKHNAQLDGTFDAIIADVPCSGLGVIRKKPEIRYHDPERLKELPEIQKRILSNVSAYVKPGGVLIYSTCTLLRRENEDVVHDFMGAHPEYELEPFVLPDPVGAAEKGMITLWPHIHGTDGFFIAKLRRKV